MPKLKSFAWQGFETWPNPNNYQNFDQSEGAQMAKQAMNCRPKGRHSNALSECNEYKNVFFLNIWIFRTNFTCLIDSYARFIVNKVMIYAQINTHLWFQTTFMSYPCHWRNKYVLFNLLTCTFNMFKLGKSGNKDLKVFTIDFFNMKLNRWMNERT